MPCIYGLIDEAGQPFDREPVRPASVVDLVDASRYVGGTDRGTVVICRRRLVLVLVAVAAKMVSVADGTDVCDVSVFSTPHHAHNRSRNTDSNIDAKLS